MPWSSSICSTPHCRYVGGVAKKLLIKVLTGADDAERTNQAFTVAASAVASGA